LWEDIVTYKANNGNRHDIDYRTGLPKAQWTHIYGGIESSKGSYAKSTITVSDLETKMELAKKLLDDYNARGRVSELLSRELRGHADALTLEYVKAMLYGSKRNNPDSFNGLATIYDTCGSDNPYEIAYNCLSAGGEGTNSLGSIFLVGHGEEGYCNICPEGHPTGGVEVGEQKDCLLHESNAPQKTFEGIYQFLRLRGAAFIADWRKCGRIANINRNPVFADRAARAEAADKFFDILDQLTTRVDEKGVKQCLYMDKGTLALIKRFSSTLTRDNAITEQQLGLHKVTHLNGIPVRINDAQRVDETLVPSA
jgi:hypothetical protein